MKNILAIALCAALLAIAGCTEQPPDQESLALSKKFDEVTKQRLDRFLPNIYAEAKDSFEAALDEITAQNEKSALSRSYEHAKSLMAYSDSLLARAADSLVALKDAYANRLADLKQNAEETVGDVFATAQKFKNNDAVEERMVEIRGKIASINVLLAKANTEYKSGLPLHAGFDYEQVIDGATELERELEDLKQVVAGKSKR
jgi:hypothetical protein